MKTQISTLVNGCIDGQQKTGSSEKLRAEISQRVLGENGDTLNIDINGVALVLHIHWSTTGKTFSYSCDIDEGTLNGIEGCRADVRRFQYESSFTLTIDMSMRVSVSKWARKNPNSQWKFRGYDYLKEGLVTIKD